MANSRKKSAKLLAVKAYGYLLLNLQQETDLAWKVTGESSLLPHANVGKPDGHHFWRRHEQHRELPVWEETRPLRGTKSQLGPWHVADLQGLHSLSIFVEDTHRGNYLGGKLVEFSRSCTMCYLAMVQIRDSTLEGLMLDGLQYLLDYYYVLRNSSSKTITRSSLDNLPSFNCPTLTQPTT